MIIEKLQQPKTHLECNDLTPNQKKLLWEVMGRHEALQYFAYDRFFKEGFHQWELMGINRIKREFIEAHKTEIFPEGVDTHLLPTVDEMITGKGVFYRVLGMSFGMKKQFMEYMNSLGMGNNSVVSKFTTDDWRDYERIGVMTIMEEFEREVVEN